MNERELAGKIKRGDISAMRYVYDAYSPYLTAVCRRYLSVEDDVKDTLHNAYLLVFSKIDMFEPREGSSLRAWMTRIVVNEALKLLRGRRAVEFTGYDEVIETALVPQCDTADIPMDEIVGLLHRLPERYRMVFNLYVFEEMSHGDIARMLGISATLSSTVLHRAKVAMAKMINEKYAIYHG